MTMKTIERGVHGMGLSIGTLICMASGSAYAIPLPDTGSCSGGVSCLSITSSGAGGIYGRATTGGAGVQGESNTGYGVLGISSSGPGVFGLSPNFKGISGYSMGSAITAVGAEGTCSSNSGGCVGVKGTVKPSSGGTAVFGDAGNGANNWAGYFVGDVAALAYYNNSDARLKKNIKDLSQATESILELRPVTYQWARDESDGAEQIGLIAQDVQKVFPNAVRADANSGMLSVNYIAMVPLLIKSVQEQQETIEQLESQVEALNRARTPMTQLSVVHPAALLLGGLALIPFAIIQVLRRRKAS